MFKLKLNPNGCVERARLVVKGFHHTPGIYFKDTFSLVVKATAIRLVLIVVVSKNWDINNAFLNGTL